MNTTTNTRAAEPPRVLFLVENNPYPQDFRVHREAQALTDHGYTATVIAPKSRGQTWFELIDGVAVYRFPRPPSGKGFFGYTLEFALATFAILVLAVWVALRKGVDVVHAANPPDTLFIVAVVLKLFGSKFVFDHHDLSPEIYLSRGSEAASSVSWKVLVFLERWTFFTADVVISTNESYKSIAIVRGKRRAEEVFVVRNGPPAAYLPLPPDPLLRKRAKHLLGYIGTIGPQDGLDYLVRAVHDLVNKIGRKEFLTVIVGDGDALPKIISMVKVLNLESYFHFMGRLDELDSRKVLSSVDVCVQPDPSSPLNDRSTMNKMMEYMALGKPVVAFDLPETRFSAQDGAIYASSNNVLEFAHLINSLLDDPERCKVLGQIGQRRVKEKLSWEQSVPPLLDAYASILGRALPVGEKYHL